jgi:hypothetical protein
LKSITKGLLGAATLTFVVIGLSACQTTEDGGPNHADRVVAAQDATKPEHDGTSAKPAKDAPAKPKYTTGQTQAIASATDYLDNMAFSRSGLVDQLKYEQFSVADATFAVDHIKVDWNKQAAASATDYLDTQSFSHGGLVDQLKYEGFTPKQAEYGVTQAGL